MRYEAILQTHPTVRRISTGNDGNTKAYTKDLVEVVIDENLVTPKIAELQAEYDAQEYARSRKAEYPPIEDQQDMQFHDAIDGTTTWQDAIQAVKNKYPKSG